MEDRPSIAVGGRYFEDVVIKLDHARDSDPGSSNDTGSIQGDLAENIDADGLGLEDVVMNASPSYDIVFIADLFAFAMTEALLGTP